MKKYLLILISAISICSFAQTAKNLGADISLLPKYEEYSTPYYTQSGSRISDVLTYLRDNAKMNSIRVRLFVNPTNTNKDGAFQDLAYVTSFGKRIKEAGMHFLLDIQYSDSWADPSSQTIPSSWYKGALSSSNPTDAAMVDSMYSYTKRTLEHLKANDATPDYIQVGNEISFGMLWRSNNDRCYSNTSSSVWKRFTNLLSSAIKAVREVTPEAKVILHTERVGNVYDTPENFYTMMKKNGVDYDIIGLSYYPFWHSSLSNLNSTLTRLETSFPDKEIQIVETAYYYQYFPSDSKYENTTSTWAATPAGQKAFIEDLVSTLNKHSHVTGLYYWCAEENGSGGSSWNANKIVINSWLNRGLWDNSSHKAQPGLMSLQKFNGDNAMGIKAFPKGYDKESIYNLQGTKISTIPANGIYIKGGKKYY